MIDTETARAFLMSESANAAEQVKTLMTTNVSVAALLVGLSALTSVLVIHNLIVSGKSKAEHDMARAKRKAERRTAVDRMHDALFDAYHREEISKATYHWAVQQLGDAGFTDMRPHWERIKSAGRMQAQELTSHLAKLKQRLLAKHPNANARIFHRENSYTAALAAKKEEETGTINVEAA